MSTNSAVNAYQKHFQYHLLDVWRLVACLVIMWGHKYHLGIESDSPFLNSWVYVEFFFIISGYFTYAHFIRCKEKKINVHPVAYTIKKFSFYMPYIFVTVFVKCLMSYLCEGGNRLTRFFTAVLESLLVTRGDGNNGVIWYLQAMFVIFPLFCLAIKEIRRDVCFIFAWLIVILYGNYSGWKGYYLFPVHLLRALAGLSLGVIVFVISSELGKLRLTTCGKYIMTLIEEGALVLAFLMNGFNRGTPEILVFLYTIGLIATFSNQTYTSAVKIKFSNFLKEMSFFMYLVQFVVADGLYMFTKGLSHTMLLLLYFVGTALISVMFLIYEKCIRKKLERGLSVLFTFAGDSSELPS